MTCVSRPDLPPAIAVIDHACELLRAALSVLDGADIVHGCADIDLALNRLEAERAKLAG